MRTYGVTVATVISAIGFASSAHAQPERQRVDFRAIFQQLDANRDGVVVRDEVPKKGLEAFDKILKHCDDNDDGKLQTEEMRSMATKMFRAAANDVPNASPEDIAKMDKNDDGKVARSEFTGPAPLFGLIDLNRDGSLSKEEIEKFGEDKPFKNQPAPEPPAMQPRPGQSPGFGPGMLNGERLRAMDANRDRKISRDEFQGPPQLFERLDLNKDGFISPEDRDSAGPGMERLREALKKGATKKAERKSAINKAESKPQQPAKTESKP